jgi:hypothetical protein
MGTCAVLMLLLITGCGEPPEPPPQPEPVEVTVLGRGQNADLPRDFEHEVIRSEEEWNALVERLHPNNELPVVNFEDTVVLLAARRVNTGGHYNQFEYHL